MGFMRSQLRYSEGSGPEGGGQRFNELSFAVVNDSQEMETGLGGRIREFRSQKGLTQAALAEQAELSAAYVSELENGVASRPSGQVLMQLSTVLGVTIADLLGTAPPAPQSAAPPGLEEFALDRGLPQVDVDMLAGIKFRGEPPRTPRRWAIIYDTISSSRTLDE